MNHFFVPEQYMGANRKVDTWLNKDPRVEAYYFNVFGGKLEVCSQPLENGTRITRINFQIEGKCSYSAGTQEINDEEDFNERAASVISNAIEYLKKEKEHKN